MRKVADRDNVEKISPANTQKCCSFSMECEAPAAGAEDLGESELGEIELGETELGVWAGRAPGPHRAAGWCTEHRNFLPRR